MNDGDGEKSIKTKVKYVTNKEFLLLLIEHKQKKENNPDTRCSDKIATVFLLMANRIFNKPNFYKWHSIREDCVMNAVEYCLRYMDNFSSDISENPFAYFQSIIESAFIQTIVKEMKKLDTIEELKTQLKNDCFFNIKNGNKIYREFNTVKDNEEHDHKEIKIEKLEKLICWDDKLVVQCNSFILDNLF